MPLKFFPAEGTVGNCPSKFHHKFRLLSDKSFPSKITDGFLFSDDVEPTLETVGFPSKKATSYGLPTVLAVDFGVPSCSVKSYDEESNKTNKQPREAAVNSCINKMTFGVK